MISLLSLLIWLYLFFLHGKFWRSGPQLPPAAPSELPEVDIIVPARDEAETIGPVIASLLAQDYAGKFHIVLVDDDSTDGTAERAGAAESLQVIRGTPKPPGWSGKLWALSQGIDATDAPVVLLTDADIVHDPRHLSSLIARLAHPPVAMVSEMVRLKLHEHGRARTGAGIRVLLSDALSIRQGQRSLLERCRGRRRDSTHSPRGVGAHRWDPVDPGCPDR
jgi:glycosyltransferase involved in cell wall biosynthesis